MNRLRAILRGLTIGLAIAAAGIVFSFVTAHSLKRARAAEALSASDVLDSVRALGLAPDGPAVRRGAYYVLHAIDPRGNELRVVADAHFGDIVAVRPAAPYYVTAPYVRGPHIIHVPQPEDARADFDDGRGDNAAPGDDADAPTVRPPDLPHRPAEQHHSALPPPPRQAVRAVPPPRQAVGEVPPPQQAVGDVPPLPSDDALSPIHPTPDFTHKDVTADKFSPAAPPPANR